MKITDAGLRSIGDSCHSLLYLDISKAKSVSDVGIACIATGCPQIKTIKYHGLYLLADPRMSAPKKGENVEAWQSIVGIASVGQYSNKIENLDLSGCFRLNVGILSYVSGMTTLKSLNLMGCNQVSSDALTAVGRKCKNLEEINFSDCGKSVNGDVMSAFAVNCPNMKIISLARSLNVRGSAIKAIAEFKKLEKLDLTGCVNLTDLMLIPITEIDKVLPLRTLILVNIPKVSDTTLSFVANGCPNLLLFGFKGTAITRFAVSAVKDR